MNVYWSAFQDTEELSGKEPAPQNEDAELENLARGWTSWNESQDFVKYCQACKLSTGQS